MKKSSHSFLKLALAALTAFTFFFTSCEIGMGQSVDLEAPEITITSPEKFSYQGLQIEFEGTCKDNVKVDKVIISDKETGRVFGNATITGETWSFYLELEPEDEGEITFLCEAKDPSNNTSTHSARTITLLVDENAPIAKSWYVDRGNSIQTLLEQKSFLEGLDFTLSRNKNYPQNQEFTLYGSFYDAMGIDVITVKLFEDAYSTKNPIAEKTVAANKISNFYIGDGKSIYSPSFNFTESDLVAGNPACNTGKHYLRVVYYAKDNDDPVNFNEREVDTEKYILWYPESDKPGVQIQPELINGEGKIRASVGSSIPVDFFDDDGLKEIHCSLRKSITGTIAEYTASLIENESTRTAAFVDNTAQDEPAVSKTNFSTTSYQTDYPQTITAPETPMQMYLVSAAKDINDKWNARVISVEVTDSNKPMLFIESPIENENPTMEGGSDRVFKFKGYSLDTKGAKYIKIIYVPTNDQTSAETLFKTYKTDTTAKKVISGTNEVIWHKDITGGTTDSNGWIKQLFEIEMNLFTDFNNAAGTSMATKQKFFLICLVDTDGNEVFKPFILNGDEAQPLIDIKLPEKELDVHDYTLNDLVLRFKGYKNSGIGMDASKYKVTTKIGTGTDSDKVFVRGTGATDITAPDSEGYVSLTIPKETLAEWAKTEAQPTFTFYATDILGNGGIGEDMRSVILSPRPHIEAITVNKNNGTYKKGDELEFKVSFSKQVKVTGTPKLKIKYSSSDANPKLAAYTGGNETNALTFKFTVPENAESEGIICDGFETEKKKDEEGNDTDEDILTGGAAIRATELGEGDIYFDLPAGEVLKGKSEIKLDGVTPKINSIAISSDGLKDASNNEYCTKDKTITAVLTMSENVLVSDSPELKLKAGTNDIVFSFEKMDTNANTITFVHKVVSTGTGKSPEGKISYALASCFSDAHKAYLTDKAGNVIDLSKNSSADDTKVYIDYTSPTSAPGLKDLVNQTIYTSAQELELTEIDTDAMGYYSTNGGVSWIAYDGENKETLGNGSYKIITYQQDKAGNKSPYSQPTEIVVNSNFAPVTNFSINLADGNYKENTEFTFTLNFESDVIIDDASDIQLTFQTMEAGKTTSKTINAEIPLDENGQPKKNTDEVTFKYKVTSSDYFDGVQVTGIVFVDGFKDANGNSPAFGGTGTSHKLTPTNCPYLAATDGGTRSKIVLDGVLPTIVTYDPAMNENNSGIAAMTDNSSGSFKITLEFSEKVYKEAGTIILQRKGNWSIPAVLSVDEFNKYYNKMTTANKTKMLKLDSDGYEQLDTQTGIAVGPYRKITHGLKLVNEKYIPDDETKYVLAYELGLEIGSAVLDADSDDNKFTASVADIRSALESVGYHQHKVDVSSDYVTITDAGTDGGGKIVEITFQEAIEDGREWQLLIPPKAFRDNTENFYKGMNLQLDSTIDEDQQNASDKYSLWSNNVAQPVVRVDRYTHGWGAHEPNADGTFTDITANNGKYRGKDDPDAVAVAGSSAVISPTGYCRVRIDCETPGATILYSKVFNNGTVYTTNVPAGASFNGGSVDDNTTDHTNKRNTVADITQANLEKRGESSYTQGANILIGDGIYTTARKDYITAYATKTGFEASANGYEGIFKTLVYVDSNKDLRCWLNMEGGTAAGGQPSVNGFPLKDATDEGDPTGAGRYSKNLYSINGDSQNAFVFVSYEIISTNWAILLCGTNHSKDYPLNSYGEAAWITKQNFHSGTSF